MLVRNSKIPPIAKRGGKVQKNSSLVKSTTPLGRVKAVLEAGETPENRDLNHLRSEIYNGRLGKDTIECLKGKGVI